MWTAAHVDVLIRVSSESCDHRSMINRVRTVSTLLFVTGGFGVGMGCGIGQFPNYEAVLHCEYDDPETVEDDTEENDYCVVAGSLCWNSPIPSALELCSWAWFGDLDHFEGMDGTLGAKQDAGFCSNTETTANFPSSYSDENGGTKSKSCVGPGGNGGGDDDDDTGVPTTGVTTISEDTGVETDTENEANDGPGDYFCSLRSRHKCANLDPDEAAILFGGDKYDRDLMVHPEDANYDACWTSEVNVDNPNVKHKSKCVYAASRIAATAACEDLCEGKYKEIAEGCSSPDCDVIKNIDCILEGDWEDAFGTPHSGDDLELPSRQELIGNYECDGEPLIMDGDPHVSFTSSATFSMPGGFLASAANGVQGILGFDLGACASTAFTCPITITTLVSITDHIEGGYVDASGGGGAFAVQTIGFQSRQSFSGTWDKARKTVSFTSEAMPAQFWAGNVIIDNAPVPSEYLVYNVDADQIVGRLDSEDGPLTLNVAYEVPSLGMAYFTIVSESY